MYTTLLVLLIIVSIFLAIAILAQAGKGGGVAASFGGASSSAEAFIGMRQAGNILTKSSWWLGGIFLFLTFVLQIMSARSRTPSSILERAAPAPATTPQGTTPAGQAPAVPLEPAPATGQSGQPQNAPAPVQPPPRP